MGLNRQQLLKVRKVRYLDAKIKHRRRRHIELQMQRTLLNQLRIEIAADRKAA